MPKIIILDPGHGGTNSEGIFDPGACANGLKESDLTGDLCDRIATKLSAYDVDVRLCPRTDDLSERAAFANNAGADFFLSIHCNAGGGQGFESYTYTNASTESERVRKFIHESVIEHLQKFSVVDRGMKKANFAVLRETSMPAALLECLFVDNANDAALLKNDTFLNVLANGIAWGLVVAFDLQKKVVTDPCANCQKVNDLIVERGNLFAENTKLRQIISQAEGILASAKL